MNMDYLELIDEDEQHFAFESIKNLIGDPPTDGTPLLQIAASEFEDILPCKPKETISVS